MKINPKQVTNYDRTNEELERFWLFCAFVAGKNADVASDKLSKFLSRKPDDVLPFDYLRDNLSDIHNMLVAHKVGQYYRMERIIRESVDLDLRRCTVSDLEKVYGIGPKTARMFILHTRKGAMHAVLDVHILRWLGTHCPDCRIPKQTPQKPEEYFRLETLFINMATIYYQGIPLADVDLLLWSMMSGRLDGDRYEPMLPGIAEPPG